MVLDMLLLILEWCDMTTYDSGVVHTFDQSMYIKKDDASKVPTYMLV